MGNNEGFDGFITWLCKSQNMEDETYKGLEYDLNVS